MIKVDQCKILAYPQVISWVVLSTSKQRTCAQWFQSSCSVWLKTCRLMFCQRTFWVQFLICGVARAYNMNLVHYLKNVYVVWFKKIHVWLHSKLHVNYIFSFLKEQRNNFIQLYIIVGCGVKQLNIVEECHKTMRYLKGFTHQEDATGWSEQWLIHTRNTNTTKANMFIDMLIT